MGIFTKTFMWPFLCIPRVVLFITTYFGHSTTKNSLKYQIWNFAFWVDKMSQNRAIFLKLPIGRKEKKKRKEDRKQKKKKEKKIKKRERKEKKDTFQIPRRWINTIYPHKSY